MYFLDPAIWFFIFGIIAGLCKSNLEIPDSITKFLGIYLLMTLGWKAGVALNDFAYSQEMIKALTISISAGFLLPIVNFQFLKRYLSIYDSAALAATFGSCGAITYLAATQYLRANKVPYDDFMITCMIAMQIPAIVISVALCSFLRQNHAAGVKQVIFETLTEGAIFVLISSFAIGLLNPNFEIQLADGEIPPFKLDVFRLLLSIFLLDMGIQTAKNLKKLPKNSYFCVLYALIIPLVHAVIAFFACNLLNLSSSNCFIMMILFASANYIAVPAVLKTAIPEANPGLYLGLSLGVSFPLNVLICIPLFYKILGL